MGGEAQHRESPNKWKWGISQTTLAPTSGKSVLGNARLVRHSLMGAYSTQKMCRVVDFLNSKLLVWRGVKRLPPNLSQTFAI